MTFQYLGPVGIGFAWDAGFHDASAVYLWCFDSMVGHQKHGLVASLRLG